MLKTKVYAVKSAESGFESFEFDRRELNAKDVTAELTWGETAATPAKV